ncbi:MAG: pirin family protein [Kangiellaceae bacterium]|jgi:redox-sensitive bicupin YhaK (pirin superfamily)|nr:pirin family protein [Kangiellaceae bacterium]
MTERTIMQLIPAQAASDGAGVKLKRLIGNGGLQGFDPFLMLDEFNSDNPDDYIAGFPSHPHRGFETVTYMLEGNMLHEDHMGNQGLLQSGDVQWMTAARGIIHSEIPQQVDGLMRGFQLWINLPAAEKMKDPSYKDIKSADIPVVEKDNVWIKVVAGELNLYGEVTKGAVHGISTAPLYLDVVLKADADLTLPVPDDHKVMVYVYEGELSIGDRTVKSQHMVITSKGDLLKLQAGSNGVKALVLGGKPLNEPIANWGPFVMNTREEIEQAMTDYRNGTLTQ